MMNVLTINTGNKDFARIIREGKNRTEKREARRVKHWKILYRLVVSLEVLGIVIVIGISVGRLYGG